MIMIMNTIILAVISACLIFIAGSLNSIAKILWNILQELKRIAEKY